MSEDVTVWFVHREYTDKGLITLEYATPDGEWVFVKQISPQSSDPTAAKEVSEADLQRVNDPETRDRYRSEAARVQDRHDPDDTV